MNDPTHRCGWDVGTVYTGWRICGKPAKASVDTRYLVTPGNGLVCGIHLRTARRYMPDSAIKMLDKIRTTRKT